MLGDNQKKEKGTHNSLFELLGAANNLTYLKTEGVPYNCLLRTMTRHFQFSRYVHY